ncbi:MAG: 2-succinyl-6-hydroxy-2,4-cyclohexadiene-1-carboxylate synthase [Solirubrobacteraceae bacterium]
MIVLLHGFGGTHQHWDALPRERYIAPDLRGHGAHPQLPATLSAQLADIAGIAPESFELCGYSMGARVALHAALSMPARVRRLTLVSGTAGIADAAERAARAAADERLAQRIESGPIERFAEEWAGVELFAGDPPAVRDLAARDSLRCTPEGLAAALRGLGAATVTAVWQRLEELRMPVRILAGERDRKYVAIAERLADRIAQAELVIVPRAGHRLALEAPETILT